MMKLLKAVLPVLTVVMIAFIWVHSMMPGEVSSAESGFLTEFLNHFLGDSVIDEHLIRKTAHFAEYMLLGIICCADLFVYGKKGINCMAAALYICLATAVTDESIQLFSVGRSGMLFDLWLDHIGSVTGVLSFNVIKHTIKI